MEKIKSKENKNLEDFNDKIHGELLKLKIDFSHFSNPITELSKRLYKFLIRYEIDIEEFFKPNLIFKGLCLMDTWMQAAKDKDLNSVKELNKIANRFKYLCITAQNGKYKQLSKKVLRASARNKLNAEVFDPDSGNDNTFNSYRSLLDKYTNTERSKFVNENIKLLFPEINTLIEKFDLFSNEKNIDIEVKILNLSSEELINYPVNETVKMDCNAFFYTNGTKTEIAIPYNSNVFRRVFIHEFVHALSHKGGHGITEGFVGHLGNGANEALTEAKNFEISSYANPRYILSKIFKISPELEQLAYDCYFGKKDRMNLTVALFNTFGSEGVVKFDFMASTPIPGVGNLEHYILFDFEACLEFFTRNIKDSFNSRIDLINSLPNKFNKERVTKLIEGYENRSKEEKSFWSQKFGCFIALIGYNLRDTLSDCNKKIPLEYLLEEENKLAEFDDFIKELDLYDDFTTETDSNSKTLEDLFDRLYDWSTFLNNQIYKYQNKANHKPLYKYKNALKYETQYLKSQLMQGRNLFED